MKSVIVDLFIGADEYLKYYQYPGAMVYATSRDGKSIQFPANIIQRYVTHTGIHGSFSIVYDDTGKFKSIDAL